MQGDQAEVDAICGVFGNSSTSAANSQCGTAGVDPNVPMMGCTKGNFGHSLVAAGFAGMAKVLLSMQHNVIPGTPGVTNPIHGNVIVENHPWPERRDGAPRRAGLSAFGFGGTNAHAVFEEFRKDQTQTIARPINGQAAAIRRVNRVTRGALGIVGMAARFGDLPDINAFERALYEGTDASCALPDKRWRFLGEDPAFYKKIGATRDTRGCFIGSVDVDFKRLVPTVQTSSFHSSCSL